MPPVPSTLALDNISDGAGINAQPLRDNYTEIQAEFNKVAAILDGGAVGDILTRDGSGADWAPPGSVLTYVPVWSGSGTPPAIGNGTIEGRYVKLGKLVQVFCQITMGGTTTYGTGNWTISLPFDIATFSPHGQAVYSDFSGGVIYAGMARRFTTGTVILLNNASPLAAIGATAPFTWAVADTLHFQLAYEVA